jgi:hypothetical protein
MIGGQSWGGEMKAGTCLGHCRSDHLRMSGVVLYAARMVNWSAYRPLELLPPPPGSYFTLLPAGSDASLPGDAEAAAMIRKSGWGSRPDNTEYNYTISAALVIRRQYMADHAYHPRWNKYVLGRITGNSQVLPMRHSSGQPQSATTPTGSSGIAPARAGAGTRPRLESAGCRGVAVGDAFRVNILTGAG